jgi:hypothetical protein
MQAAISAVATAKSVDDAIITSISGTGTNLNKPTRWSFGKGDNRHRPLSAVKPNWFDRAEISRQ